MKLSPFAGFSGLTDPGVLETICNSRPDHFARRLSVGLLVNYDTLNGEVSKWHPERHVRPADIAKFCQGLPGLYVTVHYYAPREHLDTLGSQLESIIRLSRKQIDGIQLNIPWVPVDVLQEFRRNHAGCAIILQVGEEMVRTCAGDAGSLARRVSSYYSGLADHLLLDLSGGQGTSIDRAWAQDCLLELTRGMPNTGLVIAGGLGPTVESLEGLRFLLEIFPQLSCDAESRLMEGPNQKTDILKVVNYINALHKLFGSWGCGLQKPASQRPVFFYSNLIELGPDVS